jgi:hypothetical protein
MNQYLVTRTITETIVVEADNEDEAVDVASGEVAGWETDDAADTYMVELLKAEGK